VRYRTPPHCGFAIAEIYNWFTKGFELPDLKDAKALLELRVIFFCSVSSLGKTDGGCDRRFRSM